MFFEREIKLGRKFNVNSYVSAKKFTHNLLHLQNAKKSLILSDCGSLCIPYLRFHILLSANPKDKKSNYVEKIYMKDFKNQKNLRRFYLFLEREIKLGRKFNVNSYVSARKFTNNLLHLQNAKKSLMLSDWGSFCIPYLRFHILLSANPKDKKSNYVEKIYMKDFKKSKEFKTLLFVFRAGNKIGPKVQCEFLCISKKIHTQPATLTVAEKAQ